MSIEERERCRDEERQSIDIQVGQWSLKHGHSIPIPIIFQPLFKLTRVCGFPVVYDFGSLRYTN